MKGTPEEFAFRQHLQDVVENSGRKIDGSAAFVSIFTAHFSESPQATLEFGIAVLLGKPIYLLLAKGTPVNENVRRLARGIEEYDPLDPKTIESASLRLIGQAKEDLAREG